MSSYDPETILIDYRVTHRPEIRWSEYNEKIEIVGDDNDDNTEKGFKNKIAFSKLFFKTIDFYQRMSIMIIVK